MKTIVFCIENFFEENKINNLLKKYFSINNKGNIKYVIITKQSHINQKKIIKNDNLEIINSKSFFFLKYKINFFYGFNIFKYGKKADKIFFINPNISFGFFPLFLKPSRKISVFDKNIFSKINFIYLKIFLLLSNKILSFYKKGNIFNLFRNKIIFLKPFIDIDEIISSNENIINIKNKNNIGVLIGENFIALDILLKSINREVLKDFNFNILIGYTSNIKPDLQIINNDKIIILNDINNSNIKSYFENIDNLFIFDAKLNKIETFYQIILGIYFKKLIFIGEGVKYFSFFDKYENIIKFNKHSSLDISGKISNLKDIKLNNYSKEIKNNYSTKNIIYDLQKIIEY